MAGQAGFFDVEERLAGLSKKGDDLERLSAVVDFELFRSELEAAVPRADRSKGGRPPFDHVLMFKVLVLQTQNNLSDERTEYYLRDRLTWIRFLGLGLGDPVPDANTIWTFREQLTKAGAIELLFDLFDRQLREAGYLAMSGQLVDASIMLHLHFYTDKSRWNRKRLPRTVQQSVIVEGSQATTRKLSPNQQSQAASHSHRHNTIRINRASIQLTFASSTTHRRNRLTCSRQKRDQAVLQNCIHSQPIASHMNKCSQHLPCREPSSALPRCCL